ncbi:hypothetical protein [Streptosporangium vulgare]|uniref:hypothetical protein n=1 Tax=Streptosporangium vulgare TaxID=46190 RepID=UPI0031E01E07
MDDVDAVRRALARLVESGELRAEQVEPVALAVGEALREPGAADRVRWSEILAYVGGGLVLAGAAAFVALGWDRMTQPARITVLAVVTLLLLGVPRGSAWRPGRRPAGRPPCRAGSPRRSPRWVRARRPCAPGWRPTARRCSSPAWPGWCRGGGLRAATHRDRPAGLRRASPCSR